MSPRRDWVKLKQTRRDCPKIFHLRWDRDEFHNYVWDRESQYILSRNRDKTETLVLHCSKPEFDCCHIPRLVVGTDNMKERRIRDEQELRDKEELWEQRKSRELMDFVYQIFSVWIIMRLFLHSQCCKWKGLNFQLRCQVWSKQTDGMLSKYPVSFPPIGSTTFSQRIEIFFRNSKDGLELIIS